MRLLAALAVAGSVVGCGDAPKNLFFDQTWSVTEMSTACGMACKPESGQHLLIIYIEGSTVQRLELEWPPAQTLAPGTLTQVSVDAEPGFNQSLSFAPLPGPYPIIAAILNDAQYQRLITGLADHRLRTLVVSFPNGERWQVPAPPPGQRHRGW